MKHATLIFGLLTAAGFSSTAIAHDYLGTLGTVATATDKFYISCAAGTAKITYQVKRNTVGTSNISAKAYSPVGALTTSNGTTYSPLITLNTGAGAKFFEIKKAGTTSGSRNYILKMHCYDANNLHEPNDQPATVTYIQNQ
jgi:uncharacterized membrane protein (DUF4010 family)